MEHHKNIRGVTETDAPSTSFEEMKKEFAKWYQYQMIEEEGTDFVADWWLAKLTQSREQIKKDLLEIADAGEYEDLRRETILYFN
jgi:chemotaxis regulatin CheY-phosphate phosphatase CheZ